MSRNGGRGGRIVRYGRSGRLRSGGLRCRGARPARGAAASRRAHRTTSGAGIVGGSRRRWTIGGHGTRPEHAARPRVPAVPRLRVERGPAADRSPTRSRRSVSRETGRRRSSPLGPGHPWIVVPAVVMHLSSLPAPDGRSAPRRLAVRARAAERTARRERSGPVRPSARRSTLSTRGQPTADGRGGSTSGSRPSRHAVPVQRPDLRPDAGRRSTRTPALSGARAGRPAPASAPSWAARRGPPAPGRSPPPSSAGRSRRPRSGAPRASPPPSRATAWACSAISSAADAPLSAISRPPRHDQRQAPGGEPVQRRDRAGGDDVGAERAEPVDPVAASSARPRNTRTVLRQPEPLAPPR